MSLQNVGHICHIIRVYVYPVIFTFGILGNIICATALLKKCKETRGFGLQSLIVVNDLCLLLFNIWFFFVPNDPANWCSPLVQYANFYFFSPIMNVLFSVSPLLMLNICIERNIAVWFPFFARSQRKFLLISVVLCEYTFAMFFFFVNLTMSRYTVENCTDTFDIDPNRTAAYLFYEIFGDGITLDQFILNPLILLAIFAANVTFLVRYFQMQRFTIFVNFKRENSRKYVNEKVLAVILVTQSVLISLPQIAMLTNIVFVTVRCYLDCEHNVTDQIILCVGDLFIVLTPSSNLFAYCAISTEFRQFVTEMFTSAWRRVREALCWEYLIRHTVCIRHGNSNSAPLSIPTSSDVISSGDVTRF